VWGIRGVKIRQKVELKYEWRYLSLAVDVIQGRVLWQWTPNMKKETVRAVVKEWQEAGVEALVWDRAPGHGAKIVAAVGLPLVKQPPASPELNPAERGTSECILGLQKRKPRVSFPLFRLSNKRKRRERRRKR
jgi:hypothetical protein